MPRGKLSPLARGPRNSVKDRPNRLKLLLRRQRRLLRPTGWLGFATVIALLIVVAVHSAEPGGALARMRERLLNTTGFTGLRVTEIRVEGRANTPEALLRATLGVGIGDPILGFSVAQAARRIETLSWVDHATVERRLPGTIVVRLQERRPFAIWQNQGKFVLIDRSGQVVTNENVSDFRQLPLLVGPGAPDGAAALIDALNDHPRLSGRVVAAVRVGQRRWNLQMKSGMDVLLPEGHEAAALDRLSALEDQHRLLDRPLTLIDLRLPNMLVLRPAPGSMPAAAAAHPSAPAKKQT
ncbi:MAG TPA: cell division protein FtsQ/DivIB [Acetobacteraceae bacterium]|nr:cell division protein FtsQ/DivIB [Acetobacteraceae bacterium]